MKTNKDWKNIFPYIFLVLGCFSILQGCLTNTDSYITISGNPQSPPNEFPISESIAIDICFKISTSSLFVSPPVPFAEGISLECFVGLSFESCLHQMKESYDIDEVIGIPVEETKFKPFKNVIHAEVQGILIPDSLSGEQCFKEIQDLSCNDFNLQDIYDEDTSTILDASLLFPNGCKNLFAENFS